MHAWHQHMLSWTAPVQMPHRPVACDLQVLVGRALVHQNKRVRDVLLVRVCVQHSWGVVAESFLRNQVFHPLHVHLDKGCPWTVNTLAYACFTSALPEQSTYKPCISRKLCATCVRTMYIFCRYCQLDNYTTTQQTPSVSDLKLVGLLAELHKTTARISSLC